MQNSLNHDTPFYLFELKIKFKNGLYYLIYQILQGRIEELDEDLELERGSRSKAEKSRQFLTRELTSGARKFVHFAKLVKSQLYSRCVRTLNMKIDYIDLSNFTGSH